MRKAIIDVPSVGEVLNEEFLIPFELSQNALAKAIDVPAGRINQIVNEKRDMTAETDLRLCKFFGLSDGFFLRLQTSLDLARAKQKDEDAIVKIIPFSYIKEKKAKLKPVEELEEA